jgi:hypothetical protein
MDDAELTRQAAISVALARLAACPICFTANFPVHVQLVVELYKRQQPQLKTN